MPQPTPVPGTDDEVTLAVQALLPQVRGLAGKAILMMLASAAVGFLGLLWVWSLERPSDDSNLWILPAFAGVGGIVLAYSWMRKRQEALVMPVLARAIGLSYDKDASAFVRGLPQRLLPHRGIRSGEDLIYGRIGPHDFQMAEVKVETGGKNSRTLFRGIVARFRNAGAMPAFFLAPQDKTRPGFLFGGELSTKELEQAHSITGGGDRSYGIWVSDADRAAAPALMAVVDILTRIPERLGPEAKLYTATSNGEEMHLALNHSRNLFRVGGMFPNRDELLQDVATAMRDLSMPLALAKALIEAEEAAVTKTGG